MTVIQTRDCPGEDSLQKITVGDIDWRFDDMSGSHHKSDYLADFHFSLLSSTNVLYQITLNQPNTPHLSSYYEAYSIYWINLRIAL